MTDKTLNRRSFVRGTAGAALMASLGCGDDGAGSSAEGADGSTTTTTGEESTTSGADSTTTFDPGTTTTAAESSSGSSGEPGSSSGTTTGGSESEGSTGPSVCEPTDSDIEGPFYRPEIPIRDNLDIHGDAGVPLVLEGQVLDGECNPLVNAVVELWQASPRPPGSRPGDADATYDSSAEYRYYGQIATDARGEYRFTTLMPGWYLNGAQYRPAHLHLKVWVRGVELLTTQLYFDGDPFNDDDPWFNPLNMITPDGAGVARYDFHVTP